MYFIPRNNAIYNYIAHTNVKRRYFATLFVLAAIIIGCFYGMYMPLTAHIVLCKTELAHLQKRHEDSEQLKKSSKEFSMLIDTNKKNIQEHVVADNKREELCNMRMQFVFDTVTKLGLTLNSYGSCKEKDKKWYVKDSAQCQISGSFEQLLSFLKKIKDSQEMITLSHLAITRMKDNLFQLSCDIGIITVTK